jgi:GNAT superfamily N-acetyltransferase
MAWRLPTREWERQKGAGNERALKRLVESGEATGVLAFVDDAPVGWCSVGPRADFRGMETKVSLATDWDEHTWSVTCFFIKKDWRGRGVGRRLLEGAVKLARENGARRIEGYPVVPSSSKAALPGPFVWTGLPQMFERARFRPVPDPPRKRPIFVRRLRSR